MISLIFFFLFLLNFNSSSNLKEKIALVPFICFVFLFFPICPGVCLIFLFILFFFLCIFPNAASVSFSLFIILLQSLELFRLSLLLIIYFLLLHLSSLYFPFYCTYQFFIFFFCLFTHCRNKIKKMNCFYFVFLYHKIHIVLHSMTIKQYASKRHCLLDDLKKISSNLVEGYIFYF